MALNAAAHGFYIANGWEWHVVAGDRNAVCRSYAKQFLAGCSRTFFVHVKADMQIVNFSVIERDLQQSYLDSIKESKST